MPRLRILGVLAVGLLPVLLAGCTEPYATTSPGGAARALPRVKDQPKLGIYDYDPSPRVLSFCYNSMFDSPEQVLDLAQESCPNQGEIERIDQDFFWNGCSLTHPTRAVFTCIPGPAEPGQFQ